MCRNGDEAVDCVESGLFQFCLFLFLSPIARSNERPSDFLRVQSLSGHLNCCWMRCVVALCASQQSKKRTRHRRSTSALVTCKSFLGSRLMTTTMMIAAYTNTYTRTGTGTSATTATNKMQRKIERTITIFRLATKSSTTTTTLPTTVVNVCMSANHRRVNRSFACIHLFTRCPMPFACRCD